MIRHIVLSRTYRLSSVGESEGLAADPENRLLWRANRKRLTAEAIRDSILAISGQLSDQQGGYTIRKFSQYDWGYEFDTVRRSVYVPLFRNTLMEVFETFDVANPNVVTGRRNETTLPTQALYLLEQSLRERRGQSDRGANRATGPYRCRAGAPRLSVDAWS